MRYRTRTVTCGIITLALALAAQAAAEQRVPAQVKRVIDGDTFQVEATVWPGIVARSSVRVRGVDAPEIRRAKCGEPERRRGRAARDFVRDVIGGKDVWLVNVDHDTYPGRVVAAVRLPGGSDLATLLLAAGHARPYDGKKKRKKQC